MYWFSNDVFFSEDTWTVEKWFDLPLRSVFVMIKWIYNYFGGIERKQFTVMFLIIEKIRKY